MWDWWYHRKTAIIFINLYISNVLYLMKHKGQLLTFFISYFEFYESCVHQTIMTLRHRNAFHITDLLWGSQRASDGEGSFDITIAVSLNKLINKQSSCHQSVIRLYWCDITVNVILWISCMCPPQTHFCAPSMGLYALLLMKNFVVIFSWVWSYCGTYFTKFV